MRLGAFLISHADAVADFEINYGDFGHAVVGGGGLFLADFFKQHAGGLVNRHSQGFSQRNPAEFLTFFVELYGVIIAGTTGVVQKDEVGVAVKFPGVDAVLHKHEPDVSDVEVGFFLEFAAQGGFGGLGPLYFSARDTPESGPFVGSDH